MWINDIKSRGRISQRKEISQERRFERNSNITIIEIPNNFILWLNCDILCLREIDNLLELLWLRCDSIGSFDGVFVVLHVQALEVIGCVRGLVVHGGFESACGASVNNRSLNILGWNGHRLTRWAHCVLGFHWNNISTCSLICPSLTSCWYDTLFHGGADFWLLHHSVHRSGSNEKVLTSSLHVGADLFMGGLGKHFCLKRN